MKTEFEVVVRGAKRAGGRPGGRPGGPADVVRFMFYALRLFHLCTVYLCSVSLPTATPRCDFECEPGTVPGPCFNVIFNSTNGVYHSSVLSCSVRIRI